MALQLKTNKQKSTDYTDISQLVSARSLPNVPVMPYKNNIFTLINQFQEACWEKLAKSVKYMSS